MVSKDKLPGIGGTQGTLVSTNRSTQHFMSGHTPGIDSVDTGNVVPFQQKAAPEAQQETQDPAQSGRSGRQPYSTATPCLAEGSLIEALQHPLAPGQSRALFLLRLEQYRDLKDIFGHPVTAALQQRVAERLQHNLSKGDVIEQIAEDEFGIVVNTMHPQHVVTGIAQRLIERCSGVYALGEECLHIQASMGIALSPTDSKDPEELIRFARLALHQDDAESAAPYHFFSRQQLHKQKHHIRMMAEIQQAIAQDRLLLHYQPQYSLDSEQQIIGLEALVRMEDISGQLIPPDQFIPLAETNGLIIAIGHWVIREACQQLKRWHDAGHAHLRMAINVSPRQLIDEHLIDIITQAVIKNGLNYSDLELEITEQCLVENTATAEKVLHTLSRKGVRIALDDFGTGYSSLAYLARFPFNVLKLDRSFLKKTPDDPKSNRIVTAILAMADKLELEVIAEGIETDAQNQFLAAAGCPAGQGFGFSRPKPAEAIEPLLVEQETTHRATS